MSVLRLTVLCALLFVHPERQKPLLYIVHADWCPPCRVFDRTWTQDRDFRGAIQDAYDVRELDWDVPEQRATAIRLGVQSLPTYLAFRNQQLLARSVGFTTAFGDSEHARAVERLMSELRLEWPRADQPEPSAPQPSPPAPRDTIQPSDAREQIRALQASQQRTHEALTKSGDDTREQLRSLAEAIIKVKPLEQVAPPATTTAPAAGDGALKASWLSVVAAAGRAGLYVAAPEIAIPGTLGLTAAGWLVSRIRRRTTTAGESHRIDNLGRVVNTVTHPSVVRVDSTQRQSENHYIVKETDAVGEAYKEACRRVVAALKSDQPAAVNVIQQLEHVAGELLRGRKIVDRPSSVPQSGVWSDAEPLSQVSSS